MRTLSSWSSQRCVSFAACAATKRRQSSHAKPISHPAAAPLSDEALLLPKTTILPYASPLIGIHDLKEKGRGVIAESGVSAGTLLLIARPAAIITGPPGSDLDTDELSQAIKDSGERNSSLSLLFDGSKDMSQRAIPSLAQIAKLETPQHQLQQDLDVATLVRLNAYGEPYGDISGWSLRGQGSEFCSFLGLWPAFALLNHSCWPNASTMVLKSKDELLMLVRASREIEKGEEITMLQLLSLFPSFSLFPPSHSFPPCCR